MLTQQRQGWGRRKPPPWARINRSHPLARSLVNFFILNEGGGSTAHDIAGMRPGAFTNAPIWGKVTNNLAVDFPAAGTAYLDAAQPNDAPYTGALSIAWRGVIRTGSAFRHFAGKHLTGGASATPFDFRTDNAATPLMVLGRANTNFNIWNGPATTLNALKTYAVAAPLAIESAPTFYIDGVPTAGSAGAQNSTGASTGSNA